MDNFKNLMKKSIIPILLITLLAYIGYQIFGGMDESSSTIYFYIYLLVGFPFGIRRMWLWLVPTSFASLQVTLGILCLDILLGCLIGGIVAAFKLVYGVGYLLWFLLRLVFRPIKRQAGMV